MGEHRVVILSRDGTWTPPDPRTLGRDVEFIHAAGGYEAAAELLAQPAAALLIDLSCLTPPHRKLLHVARRLGVEILGVGAFPPGLSANDLSGMRLISMDDLPVVLRAILKPAEPAPAPAAAAPAPAVAPKKPGAQLAPARKAEYRPSPQEPTRKSRVISPAPNRDPNHPSGREDH